MQIVLLDDENIWEPHAHQQNMEWIRVKTAPEFLNYTKASAYINLAADSANADYSQLKHPVFINSVCTTLAEKNMLPHVIRINGWPGFLHKEIWEVAGTITKPAEDVFAMLQKKFIVVKDEPGFVTARILSMVINEAFFAKEDDVSTEKDIDTAMKLGTNYPFGPFEWAAKIGISNVLHLLQKLAVGDKRYTASAALKLAENKQS